MNPADWNPQVGDVYTSVTGWTWRVKCKSPDGTLGLEPVGLWHKLRWWVRGVKW